MKTQVAVWMAAVLMFGGAAQAQKLKSQKEADALMAIQNAPDPDARIAAIESMLTKFADTDFKPMLLEAAANEARGKGDAVVATVYYERSLDANPKSITALAALAKLISEGTREFDLDKEEKLTKSDGLAKKALELGPAAAKPNVNMPDADWENQKKDTMAQAHEALAAAAMARKKYDVAIAAYKLSMETGASSDPATMVRLGVVYNAAGKYDDAIAILDKAMASPDAVAQIKQVAGNEKVKALMAKKKAAPAAAPPAATPAPAAPPAAPVKQ